MIMTAIFVSTFMTSVETTIVTTALPTIINKLHGLHWQSWVFASYLLTTAVSTPIYGKLSDIKGRKVVYITGLSMFLAGSLFCGLSPNVIWLIFFRGIQGLGAGAIIPITFTIIADLFEYKKRAKMLAINNTAWGISALFGPLLGGVIVEKLNWNWIFFINIPLGIFVFIIIAIFLKNSVFEEEKTCFDYKGTFLLATTLIVLLIILQILGNVSVNVLLILILLIIFLGVAFLLIFFEKKSENPIVPLSLFNNKLFSVQIITALILSGIQIGFQVYFPIWLQTIYNIKPSIAGLAITPSPILWLISSFFVGGLIKSISVKKIVLSCLIVQMLFYIPLSFAGINFPAYMFYIIAGVTGISLGIIITINMLIAQKSVSQKLLGTATSMITLGRTLGQTISTGLFGLIFNLSLNNRVQQLKKIEFDQLNRFVGSGNAEHSIKYVDVYKKIVLHGIHNIFLLILIMFIFIIIVNFLNKKDVKS